MQKELPEDTLEPELPIVDPHHHLWDHRHRPVDKDAERSKHLLKDRWWSTQKVYMLPEILEDMYDGHNIVATVFLQAGSFYRSTGPEEFRNVGEVEVCQGIAGLSDTGLYGPTKVCAGIQGTCLLSHPNVEQVLQEMMKFRNFRGIRAGTQNLEACRPGLALLEKYGLVLDCWHHPPYNPDAILQFAEVAKAFPKVTMVLDHLGGAVGPGMGSEEVQAKWRADIAKLAESCPNVVCKVGGIQTLPNGFDLHLREVPMGSEELAELTLPWYGHVIDCFGAARCMFESNFPVDKGQVSYRVLWNAFKRIAAKKGLTEQDKADIFHNTAVRVYGLKL